MQIERGGHTKHGSYATTQCAADDLDRWREAFARDHAVRISSLVGPVLLDEIRGLISTARFEERDDRGIAQESRMVAPLLLARLVFLANDPRLIAFVREISGAHDIAGFAGRVYRFGPGGEHFDSWHDDAGHGRRVAMSINLSDGPIDGGELRLREKGGEGASFAYGDPGDVLMFRIDESLEHKVSPVRSSRPRTALAGWFVTGASLRDLLVPA